MVPFEFYSLLLSRENFFHQNSIHFTASQRRKGGVLINISSSSCIIIISSSYHCNSVTVTLDCLKSQMKNSHSILYIQFHLIIIIPFSYCKTCLLEKSNEKLVPSHIPSYTLDLETISSKIKFQSRHNCDHMNGKDQHKLMKNNVFCVQARQTCNRQCPPLSPSPLSPSHLYA